MSGTQPHETSARGELAPRKNKDWAEEQSDEEEEEEHMPRKNREPHDQKPAFKAKFIPRGPEAQRQNRDKEEYRYKKSYKGKNDRNYNEGRESQNQRNYDKKPTQQRQKRQVGKGADRTYDSRLGRQDNKRDELEDYRIEQLPRRPLPDYTNKIDIKKSESERYVELAKDMINRFDFITLRGVGKWIGQAFSVAEIVCQSVKNLDRVNIPGTDRIEEIHHPLRAGLYQRRRTRYIPMIVIELSKKSLQERHMGHQTYKNKEYAADYRRPQRRNRKQYQEKRE